MSLRVLSEQVTQSSFEEYTKKAQGQTVPSQQQVLERQARLERRSAFSSQPRQVLEQVSAPVQQQASQQVSASNHSFMGALASASSAASQLQVSHVEDVEMSVAQASKGKVLLDSFISKCPPAIREQLNSMRIDEVPSAMALLNEAAEKGVSVEIFRPLNPQSAIAVADTNTKTIRIPENYLQGENSEQVAQKALHTFLFENTNCLSAEKHNKVMSKEGLESVIKFVKEKSAPTDIDSREKVLKKCQDEFSLRIMSIETRGSLSVAKICNEAQEMGIENFPNLYKGVLANYNIFNAHPSFTEPQKETKIIRFMANKSLNIVNDSGGTHRDMYSTNFIRLLNRHNIEL